jgi:hypothetical protein
MVGGAGSFLGVCQKNGAASPTTCLLATAFPIPRLHGRSVSMLLLVDHHGR